MFPGLQPVDSAVEPTGAYLQRARQQNFATTAPYIPIPPPTKLGGIMFPGLQPPDTAVELTRTYSQRAR